MDFDRSKKRYLRRDAAAAYLQERWGLRCRPKTLAKLAVTGGGPPLHYAGRFPIYEPTELDSWARGRITGPFGSTWEHDHAV